MANTWIVQASANHVGVLQPHRDDEVATWLKQQRDQYDPKELSGYDRYHSIDLILDEYRLRADTGRSLSEELEDEGG